MKIYVLEEDNSEYTVCVSENIDLIKTQLCNKKHFRYDTYPVLKIWENGIQIDEVGGLEVIKRIAKEC